MYLIELAVNMQHNFLIGSHLYIGKVRYVLRRVAPIQLTGVAHTVQFLLKILSLSKFLFEPLVQLMMFRHLQWFV